MNNNIQNNDQNLYTAANNNFLDTLTLDRYDNQSYYFKFKHKDKLNPSHSLDLEGVAANIDPEGNAAFEEFDPEGKGEPTEINVYQNTKYKCSFYMPLTQSPIAGIEIEEVITTNSYKVLYKVKVYNQKQ